VQIFGFQKIIAGMQSCRHITSIKEVKPSGIGCEECLKSGDEWVHLRLCMECGHVGCCNDSKNAHAAKHFHVTGHPIIFSFEPGERWGWCYEDQILFEHGEDINQSRYV
jgi:uncharacterized UBP type Zn finger protein